MFSSIELLNISERTVPLAIDAVDVDVKNELVWEFCI